MSFNEERESALVALGDELFQQPAVGLLSPGLGVEESKQLRQHSSQCLVGHDSFLGAALSATV